MEDVLREYAERLHNILPIPLHYCQRRPILCPASIEEHVRGLHEYLLDHHNEIEDLWLFESPYPNTRASALATDYNIANFSGSASHTWTQLVNIFDIPPVYLKRNPSVFYAEHRILPLNAIPIACECQLRAQEAKQEIAKLYTPAIRRLIVELKLPRLRRLWLFGSIAKNCVGDPIVGDEQDIQFFRSIKQQCFIFELSHPSYAYFKSSLRNNPTTIFSHIKSIYRTLILPQKVSCWVFFKMLLKFFLIPIANYFPI